LAVHAIYYFLRHTKYLIVTHNEKYSKNPLLLKTFDFSLKVIIYADLLHEQKKFVIANQLLKSGTSIGANSKESQNAESRADFIHKLKIALKEADETEYWLFLCQNSRTYPDCKELLNLLFEIVKLLNSIIAKAKSNVDKPKII